MQGSSGHSLADALNISIRRIKNSFDMHWLFTCSNTNNGNWIDRRIELNRDDYDFIIQPAQHHFTEICTCISGTLAFKAGEHFIELKEGCSILILPGSMHCEIPIKNKDYLAMWLVVDTAKSRLHLSGNNNSEFFTSDMRFLNRYDEYNVFLDRIKHENSDYRSNSYEMMKAFLMQMFVTALREIDAVELSKENHATWKEGISSEIKEFISRSGLNHLKLRDISQEMCISENHMNSIFKSVTGMTIAQYIDNQRINKAKLLLLDPSLTINAISSQLGYYDRYHFSKVFKKATGYSPGQFRNSLAKGSEPSS